jgi:hypothetical protein
MNNKTWNYLGRRRAGRPAPKIGDPLNLHQYWFITSADDGETWQLTDFLMQAQGKIRKALLLLVQLCRSRARRESDDQRNGRGTRRSRPATAN